MAWALEGAALSIALAGAASRMGLFTRRGSFIAGAVGVAIALLSGIKWLLLLILFVLLGILATKVALNWKYNRGLVEGDDGSSSGRNVLANGGVPLLMVLLSGTGTGPESQLLAVYAGAIATATADTLSSEIGVLSSNTRLITAPWREVEAGVDGGVSVLGEAWAAVGSLLIGVTSATFFGYSYLAPVALGGFLGCQLDSVMGATMERRGILNNEAVNLFATALGGLLALAVY